MGFLRPVECLRAETLEPTTLGSNSNCATSRLGELGGLASLLCASISSSGKWAHSNCTSGVAVLMKRAGVLRTLGTWVL